MRDNTVTWHLINRLVPNPSYSGTYGAETFEWLDLIPMPTETEIDNEEVIWQEELSKDARKEKAKKEYHEELSKGYTFTDGNIYYCTKAGLSDMAMAVVLLDLTNDEIVTCFTMDNRTVTLNAAVFKDLAKKCGQHHYNLRQLYWEALNIA